MRVLLVHSFWHPRGGDTTCLFAEADALAAAGHEVIPFAMRHPNNLPSPWEVRFPAWRDPASASGLGRLSAAMRAIYGPGVARALNDLLDDVPIDVAHIHHLHRHLTPSVLRVLRARKIPAVWTVHDYELICPNAMLWVDGNDCERCRGHRYQNAIVHRCKRGIVEESAAVAAEKWVHARLGVWNLVDRFIAPSRFLAGKLAHFGIPAHRIVHLPNGVPDAPAGGPPGDRWLYVGRLSPEKGLADLIAAARLLPSRRLVIVGDGPLRGRLSPPPNVEFRGAVSPGEVARALGEAGVVAVPSLWPENLPYSVLEAQLAGRAVVASRVGGIPEQIDDGRDGILLPPGRPDLLAATVDGLLEDPVRAGTLGDAGRTRVRRDNDVGRWVTSLTDLFAERVLAYR